MLMRGGALPEQWVAAEVLAPLLRVLEQMHSLGLLHRDIKPENIFLTASGRFKLGDFGLAIDARQELPFARSGTLDYMAPEVACCSVAACCAVLCCACDVGAVTSPPNLPHCPTPHTKKQKPRCCATRACRSKSRAPSAPTPRLVQQTCC